MTNEEERDRPAARENAMEQPTHDPPRPEGADLRKRAAYQLRGRGGAVSFRLDDAPDRDLAMLIEGETSGRPLEDVLAQFGTSRSRYYLKLKRFREEGLAGLFERRPGPRGPWKRPLEVVRFVVTTRLRDPSRRAEDIAADLERAGHFVSARTVQRTLIQFGLHPRRTDRASTP